MAYFKKGNLELADFIIKEGLATQSSKSPLLNLRGLIALKRNDIKAAFKAFEESYAQDPTYIDALKNLAAMELNYKAFDAALQRIGEVLEKEPENLAFQISKAVALRGMGSYPEAKALLESLQKGNPKNFDIAYNDCILHQEYIKDRETAVVRCERALSLVQKGHPKFVELGKRVKRIREEIELLKNTPPDQPTPPPTPTPTPDSPTRGNPRVTRPRRNPLSPLPTLLHLLLPLLPERPPQNREPMWRPSVSARSLCLYCSRVRS